MKSEENKRFIKLGITGVAVLAAGMLLFFLLYRAGEIAGMAKVVTGILMPFIYGAVIAYLLAPACNRLETLLRKLFRREGGQGGIFAGLAILLSMALALAVIWVLVILVFPQVWKSIVTIADAVPGQIQSANSRLHDLLAARPEFQSYWDAFSDRIIAQVEDWLKTDLLSSVGTFIDGVSSQVVVFFSTVKNLFLGILISLYFLASRRQFAAQARMLLRGLFSDRWADLIEGEILYADKMFNGFLMGKLLDSAIVAVLCFVGTTLMGFPSAALISVVVGVTNIIPFFGPFIGAIPCAILLLLENPIHCLYFVIFIVILQQVDGNLIGPRVLGNTTGLSSFWVLFSILLFGGLWGIVGMIVGVPLFAVIYDIIRRLTRLGLRRHNQEALIGEYDAAFHAPSEEKPRKKNKGNTA